MTSAYSSRISKVLAPGTASPAAGHEVVSEQRLAAGAVDQDVLGFQQPDRLLRRDDPRPSLDRVRVAVVDQIADRALDGVERAEPLRPFTQEVHQIGRDRLPERQSVLELARIEDGLDVVAVDAIGPIALDGVRDEVGRQLDHPGPRVLVPLLVEAHGEPLHRLEQRRQHEPDRPRSDDVHCSPGRHELGGGTGLRGHSPPWSSRRSRVRESTRDPRGGRRVYACRRWGRTPVAGSRGRGRRSSSRGRRSLPSGGGPVRSTSGLHPGGDR